MTTAPSRIRCLMVRQDGDKTTAMVEEISTDDLPAGEVLIRVAYSSLNFKDALAVTGHRGIVKRLPHIPGIDAAGIVEQSADPRYPEGTPVLVTGYDLGQGHWGGWAEKIRVPGDWIVPLPEGLSLREAMVLGTAGFTAAQCIMALQRNEVFPESGEVVVTGATGGVGSLATRILNKLGYDVAVVTGKVHLHDQLTRAGAKEILPRDTFSETSDRPMLSARWAGGVDCVGGDPLTTLLRSTRYGGAIAACGLVAGAELSMTLYPFLLRGVSLCGIASADCPYNKRKRIWSLLSSDWKPSELDSFWVTEVDLSDLPEKVEEMLNGKAHGRVIVRLSPPTTPTH